jgi:rhamnosyltransferase
MSAGAASVIIRARDEAMSLARCLELLREQRVETAVETIVVDGGSGDRTVQTARDGGARVHELTGREFSFGGALNLGAGRATGEVLVALSAHAFPPDELWLSRLLEPFSDPRVACASGDLYGPDGAELRGRIEQDLALARRWPQWGYSNAAGAFRAQLWRARGFRADLPGCEDKEWAWHWLQQGYICVIDRSFAVAHDHTHDSVRSIYRRARREAAAFASYLELPPYGARQLLTDWWSDIRWYDSSLRARASHRRAARLLGEYAGRRTRSR